MHEWSYWMGMAGTVAFAVTGVIAVRPKGIDLFGASVMAIVTAVGGGTIRDVIINVPVFWSINESYIWVALVSSIAAFYATPFFTRKSINKLMLFMDAVGISLFSIQAVDKVWGLDFGIPLAPVILGVITAIGGGLIRDVLAGRQNLLMSKELYAIPVLLGCVLYALILSYLPEYSVVGGMLCVLLIFVIRGLAIEKDLTVPSWLLSNAKQTNK